MDLAKEYRSRALRRVHGQQGQIDRDRSSSAGIKKPEDVIDFGFKVSTYKGGITCPTAYMIKLLQIKSRIKCMKLRRRDPSIHQNFILVGGA
jgi:hypothetical protein